MLLSEFVDLPEAALHCVFCGAKQAAAPAVPAMLPASETIVVRSCASMATSPPACVIRSPTLRPARSAALSGVTAAPAAIIKGEVFVSVGILGSAPASSSAVTASRLLDAAAASSGVEPSGSILVPVYFLGLLSRTFGSAPRASNSLTMAADG